MHKTSLNKGFELLGKELCVKEVANKWKDTLDTKVYQALLYYEVSIED